MEDNIRDDWKKFRTALPVEVPSGVSRRICHRVKRELEPSTSHVLRKILAIHVVVSAVSLLFCPQLGVGRGMGIMPFFMPFGELTCAAFCGSLFLGLSSLFTVGLLTSAELRRVSRWGGAYIPLLSALSYAALMLLGASPEWPETLAWVAGSSLGGFALFYSLTPCRLGWQKS
jgi:hypothetical protein